MAKLGLALLVTLRTETVAVDNSTIPWLGARLLPAAAIGAGIAGTVIGGASYLR